jgi:hypothetical protein
MWEIERTKKIDVEDNSAAPSLCRSLLSAADFDQSEWEILYPHLVEEGLVDPFDRTNKKMLDVLCV